MTQISLHGVAKRFGAGEPVLAGCDLEIRDNEFLVLVGPSGSGKTTLLRIIAGLEDATDGDIYFGDRRVNDIDVGDRDIAMVFQNYGLYPHMSVYNNMAFGLRRRNLTKPVIDEKVRQTAQLLGIDALLDRRPKQLSGGQRQRVALGRAIVRDPAVFLLDEPLSNLDAHLRVQMRAEILRVHRAVTATAVYVTHDQVEALTMGDRIVVINDGAIQQLGTPEELYDYPTNRFVAGFIGTPSMGFLDLARESANAGTVLRGDGVDLAVGAERSATLPDGDHFTVGVRPEHLQLVAGDGANGRPGDGRSTIRGRVSVIEPLGSEQQVAVDVSGQLITAKLARQQKVALNDPLVLAVTAHFHIFDAQSGVACR